MHNLLTYRNVVFVTGKGKSGCVTICSLANLRTGYLARILYYELGCKDSFFVLFLAVIEYQRKWIHAYLYTRKTT
jgi:hypothetical protein